MKNRFLLLAVLDGWGIGSFDKGNAIVQAKTPFFDLLDRECLRTQLSASGRHVGLPDGQMGNSEVGHLNLGAGRVVMQELPRINTSIEDKTFFINDEFNSAIMHCKKNGSSLHLIGLLSDGGVHSHINHLFALLELCKSKGLRDLYIHAFLDGRDTPPRSSIKFINSLEKKIGSLNTGSISTVMGRYYGMDRDNRWDRTRLAYDALCNGVGESSRDGIEDYIKRSYENGTSDEFVRPFVASPGDKRSLVKQDDAIIFFNFRADRIRQIVKALHDIRFSEFDRGRLVNPYMVSLTEYDKNFSIPVAYPPYFPENGLGEVVSRNKLRQLRIAETEKYAHVTFFFNGGREEPFTDEDRILIPSPKVATYDKKPEMSAYMLTDRLIEAIRSGKYNFILVNYANPDMVGHTGSMTAAISAIEAVDTCISRVVEAARMCGGDIIITADHGNSEEMVNPQTGGIVTAHSTNPVPLYIVSDKNLSIKDHGTLADVAPTVLTLLGYDLPDEMTGKSLAALCN